MADILNSALTGDADFAGAIFGTPAPDPAPAQEKPTTEATEAQEQGSEVPQEESPKEEVKKPLSKAELKTEKKTKVSKEEAAKAVEESTKKAAEPKEESKPDSMDDDLPVNPHFQDKPVADRPEGDDSEKGIQSWKEIKSELKKIREQRDEAVAKLKVTEEEKAKISQVELESVKSEIENYKTQIALLNQELKAANFERSPEYVEKIKKPLNSLQQEVKDIAEANDTDYTKLWRALAEPDVRKRTDALEDITADFKRMEQLAIVKIADKFHDLARYHEYYQKESDTLLEAERARKAQEEQQFIENDQRLQKTFAIKAWTGLEDRYDFLREVEGQDDWNNHLRSHRQAAAETNLDRLSVEERSSILAKAAVVPFLESAINHYSNQLKTQVESRDKKIAELEQQVKSLVGATPSLGTSADDSSDDSDEDVESLMNFGKTLLGR